VAYAAFEHLCLTSTDPRELPRCLKVGTTVPWVQTLIDYQDGEDERTLMRLMGDVPAAGDLIDVDGEKVLVTSVSHIPPRKKTSGVSLSVLVYSASRRRANP
jgi:hypothetical protein